MSMYLPNDDLGPTGAEGAEFIDVPVPGPEREMLSEEPDADADGEHEMLSEEPDADGGTDGSDPVGGHGPETDDPEG